MIVKLGFDFNCDHRDCTTTARFKDSNINSASEEARDNGWAVSRDRKHCYCPEHANLHRNVGAMYAYSDY